MKGLNKFIKKLFGIPVIPKPDIAVIDDSVTDSRNVPEEPICQENLKHEDFSETNPVITTDYPVSVSQQQPTPLTQLEINELDQPAAVSDFNESAVSALTTEQLEQPPQPTKTDQPTTVFDTTAFAIDEDEWIIVGASVIGNRHVSEKQPCQDNHKYEYLGKGWGIALTSDGAGSADNSHIGSKLVAECGLFRFKSLIKREGWIMNNELPAEAEWQRLSYLTLKAVRDDMDTYSQKHNFTLKSLNATIIVVIHSPDGILATHIGDGRAGYKNKEGEWKFLIKPHEGEVVGETIFLTYDFWDKYPYVMSRVLVPESIVVREKPYAFTLLSDGCERTAWQYYQKDEQTGNFFDPNKPHPPFFNPLCDYLKSLSKEKVDCDERKEKWKNFITSGTKSLVSEKDDKTMILGVLKI